MLSILVWGSLLESSVDVLKRIGVFLSCCVSFLSSLSSSIWLLRMLSNPWRITSESSRSAVF